MLFIQIWACRLRTSYIVFVICSKSDLVMFIGIPRTKGNKVLRAQEASWLPKLSVCCDNFTRLEIQMVSYLLCVTYA